MHILPICVHAKKYFLNIVNLNKPNLEFNYMFPIDLAPIRIPIGVKCIGKGIQDTQI